MNPVIEKFKDKAIERGGVFLFKGADAINIITQALHENFHVLGIDGFFLIGDKTQPSLEDSIDFTTMSTLPRDTHSTAIDFIKRYENRDMYFEVVLREEGINTEHRAPFN